ncbi:MAG: metal ABC transporter ATP-binding protein [Anaerolineaceae bacterium]|nr:metal ABC transporter ATP-binding protein [Anaerolineaceae bacterium]MBN2678580.1 metal ABC transporter ATP-binding protein [Anaerolineaceae bacterium]
MTRQRAVDMGDPARLDLRHVSAGYNGKEAITNLTLQIPHGSQVAIVGPNGAGKSTLFKVLVGLLPVQKGSIHIHARPIGQHHDCVAYIPQREEVDWMFPVSVRDVVGMGRFAHTGFLRRTNSRDRSVVEECLKKMELTEFAESPVSDLSGGQQQRVFLARALAQEPHILLMDEPFTGVDATTTETTLGLLQDLKKDKVTVLISTHDLNLAAANFDLVMLLNRKLIAFGTSENALTRETLRAAFGDKLVTMEGTFLVDDCCSPDAEHHV